MHSRKSLLLHCSKPFIKREDNHKHKRFSLRTHPTKYLITTCINNINSIISTHNSSILSPPKTNYGRNCRDKTNYPLQNRFFTLNIVYQADVSNIVENEKRIYFGLSETPFKERYGNHKKGTAMQLNCRDMYGN